MVSGRIALLKFWSGEMGRRALHTILTYTEARFRLIENLRITLLFLYNYNSPGPIK